MTEPWDSDGCGPKPDDQIAGTIKWIEDIAKQLDRQPERYEMATVYRYRVPGIKALAASHQEQAREIAELKQALTGDGSVRAEMYRKVYAKQAAEIARLAPLKVEDLQAEIERLKAENAELRTMVQQESSFTSEQVDWLLGERLTLKKR